MSESIWSREIEEGLKNFFNSFLHSKKDVPINVKVRKPDEDFMHEEYPIIYLQNLSQSLNTLRYDPTRTKEISRDENTLKVVREEAPIAIDCTYQVDFYSLYQSEINTMVQKFFAKTHGGRFFNLPVKDQSGNDWDLLVMRKGSGNFNRADYFDKETRLFHCSFSFIVQTQLNENVRSEKYYVLTADLTNNGEMEGES